MKKVTYHISSGPIKIRFKSLTDGRQSVYFDIYVNGKRTYKFLHKYLVPEKNRLDKQINAQTMKEIEIIRANIMCYLQSHPDGVLNPLSNNVTLVGFLQAYKKSREKKYRLKHPLEPGLKVERANGINKLIRHLQNYQKYDVLLSKVDKEFCLNFLNYLRTAPNLRTSNTSKILSATTVRNYYEILNSALKLAVAKDFLFFNPMDKLTADERPPNVRHDRDYLTIEELRTLINTPCRNNQTKSAFILSCYSGLRDSDILRLTWGSIKSAEMNGQSRTCLSLTMLKTGRQISIPLPQDALSWLPDRGNKKDKDKVFTLASSSCRNKTLTKWGLSAGLSKHITMHVARHTYATSLLTLGVPIEIISSLLGHTEISTTQIYAKIVDSRRNEAVDLLDKIKEGTNKMN